MFSKKIACFVFALSFASQLAFASANPTDDVSDWYHLDNEAGQLLIKSKNPQSLITKLRNDTHTGGIDGQIIL